MQRYALFPEHANFSGIFFVKKGILGLSLTWVKGMGRAYILYIYANGREGQAPQPSCGEQDGRRWTGGAGGKAGTEGRRDRAAKLRGTVAIMEGEREMDEPRSRAAGNRTEDRGTERGTGTGREETEDGGNRKEP